MKRSTEVKLPAKLVDEIDGFARGIKKFSGVEVTREQATHALLKRGLKAVRQYSFVDPLQLLARGAEPKK